MLAFHAVDDATAHVLRVEHVIGELVIGLREQQVGPGHLDQVLRPQAANDVVDGAGSFDLGECFAVPVMNGRGLTVEDKLHVGIAACPCGTEPGRAIHEDVTGRRELDLLQLGSEEDLDVGVIGRRQGLLARHVVGHGLQDLAGVAFLRPRRRGAEEEEC